MTPEAVAHVSPPLPGRAVIRQHWADAVFLHWRVDPAEVAPWLPPGTRPDTTPDGASSEAGTIRIITNKPQVGSFSGRIDVEGNKVTNGDFGGSVEGMINVPIAGSAALRVIGFYQRDAGFIDNVARTATYLYNLPAGPGDPPASRLTFNNSNVIDDNINSVVKTSLSFCMVY